MPYLFPRGHDFLMERGDGHRAVSGWPRRAAVKALDSSWEVPQQSISAPRAVRSAPRGVQQVGPGHGHSWAQGQQASSLWGAAAIRGHASLQEGSTIHLPHCRPPPPKKKKGRPKTPKKFSPNRAAIDTFFLQIAYTRMLFAK